MRKMHPTQPIEPLECRVLLSRAVGADISQYQGTMSWTTYKNANGGQNFAFIRASSSDFGANADANGNAIDTAFGVNATNAKNAGVLYGVYHFADPTNSLQTAVQQANYFLATAQSRMTTGYLPPVVDAEKGGPELGVTAYSQWINDFCNRIYTVTGVRPLIYANSNYATNYLNSSVTQWPLWIARWNGQDPQTYVLQSGSLGTGVWPASAWKFWQYTNQGSGPTYGASGNQFIDLDVYNGDATALQSFVIGAPEITVMQGATNIVDGTTTPSNFGSVTQGQPGPSYTFTVTNAGGQILTLSGLSVPTGYTITEGLSSQLFTGQSDTFTVQLDNSVVGTKSGNISFTNNDADGGDGIETPFNFAITGTVNSSTALNAPTNMAVAGTTSSSVSLSWTDASTGEQSYLVERKTGAGGTYAQIDSIPANSAAYTDNSVAPGTNYYYRVRVYGGGTTYGPYGSEVSTTTYAAVPTGVAASDGTFTNRVHLDWDAAGGAVSYQLYRSTTNNPATAGLLAPSPTNSYDDTGAVPGTTYYYWVASRDSLNRLSAKSTSDAGFRAVDNTPPQVVSSDFDFTVAPQPVTFVFSEDVSASLDPSYLTVTVVGSGDPVGVIDVTYNSQTNTASFDLQRPLADADYQAVLAGSFVTDAAGNPLNGNPTVSFFYLMADANHDRAVDTSDFNIMAANFGQSGKTFADGDFNYDGNVDSVDFNLLAGQFGKPLEPAGATPAAGQPNPGAQRPAWSDILIPSTDGNLREAILE